MMRMLRLIIRLRLELTTFRESQRAEPRAFELAIDHRPELPESDAGLDCANNI